MEKAVSIPVVVGVTGHRDTREQDRETLKAAVKGELEALQAKCPHTPVVVMTGLAEGADTLCAETALEVGLGLISVLPMPLSEYAADFDTEAAAKLFELAEKSDTCFVSPALEEYDERYGSVRDWKYRQSGLYIAKHSHVLMALWDGTTGDECGCGTASIAEAMLRGSFGGFGSRQLHPDDRAVIQIVTPRSGEPVGCKRRSGQAKPAYCGAPAAASKTGAVKKQIADISAPVRAAASAESAAMPAAAKAGDVIIRGDAAALARILRDTAIFNSDLDRNFMYKKRKAPGDDCEEETASLKESNSADSAALGHCFEDAKEPQTDRVKQRLKKVYDAGDKMSVDNAVKHNRYLAVLSTAATMLAMAFLIYDEADWYGMIAVCGIMIIALFAINAFGRRSKYQARYLEYRVLAELLRVQLHLREAGLSCEVSDIMPWNLQLSMPWIKRAASAATIGKSPKTRSSILDSWVRDQKEYHKGALIKAERRMKSNDRIIRVALVMTLAIYAFALTFELYCGGLSGGRHIFTPEVDETIRMYIKIAMGTFSAGTLFASNYYGKQALPNVVDDHRKMASLYEEAESEIERRGETEDLLIRLAEDELTENANWYAYQSKNEPDLGI